MYVIIHECSIDFHIQHFLYTSNIKEYHIQFVRNDFYLIYHQQNSLQHQKHKEELPSEVFNETDMLLQWNKFAQKMTDSGKRLMATYMQMNDPTLNGTTITLELPNQSTKEEFLTGCHELIGYLRGKLHNHDITIEVVVNETVENKYAFTPQEKFERLKQINPTIELLRKTFDLDV